MLQITAETEIFRSSFTEKRNYHPEKIRGTQPIKLTDFKTFDVGANGGHHPTTLVTDYEGVVAKTHRPHV